MTQDFLVHGQDTVTQSPRTLRLAAISKPEAASLGNSLGLSITKVEPAPPAAPASSPTSLPSSNAPHAGPATIPYASRLLPAPKFRTLQILACLLLVASTGVLFPARFNAPEIPYNVFFAILGYTVAVAAFALRHVAIIVTPPFLEQPAGPGGS